MKQVTMRFSFGIAAGLTSVVLSLSVLPSALARPNTDHSIFKDRDIQAQESATRPLYYEHKYQRIYRNDHLDLNQPATVRVKVKRANDESSKKPNAPRGIPAPRIKSTKVLGHSPSEPEMEFINLPDPPPPKLPQKMYQPKVNTALIQSPTYSTPYNGSGSVSLDSSTRPYLEKLKYTPRMSRDGGLGGKIGGHNLFIFADTMSYAAENQQWTGFVSNSVAANHGHQIKEGKPPVLHDKLGEWANNMGTMRNWIPFTEGEAAFNAKMAGKGQRYAIWPASSLIPIDSESSLLYSPIIFTNTDNGDSLSSVVTTVGTTVSKVTYPGRGGAIAERINPMLFPFEGGVEWGAIGGIRSFGPSGVDGGKVYIMGNHKGGLKLGRVDVDKAADSSAYEFWHSSGTWSASKAGRDSADNFIDGEYSNADIFYSPRHSTFILTFMTPYADNKFYWQYLQAPTPIKPSGSNDFVENITKHPWSSPVELMNLPKAPGDSYAYAGGMHQGYFDKHDITNGGTKMLMTWTQPNGHSPSSPETGFYHMNAEVTFG